MIFVRLSVCPPLEANDHHFKCWTFSFSFAARAEARAGGTPTAPVLKAQPLGYQVKSLHESSLKMKVQSSVEFMNQKVLEMDGNIPSMHHMIIPRHYCVIYLQNISKKDVMKINRLFFVICIFVFIYVTTLA